MIFAQHFERQERDQEHAETMAMLAAEREAVERLRESYRALAQAAREAAEALMPKAAWGEECR